MASSQPAVIDLKVNRRVSYREAFSFVDQDFTGSTLKMQVRKVKDLSGTAYMDMVSPSGLSITYTGTATASAHIAAGRLTAQIYEVKNPTTGNLYQPTDNILLSQITFGINPSTIAGVPVSPEIGEDVVCYYDLLRSSGSDYEIIMKGEFVVVAGVTIP